MNKKPLISVIIPVYKVEQYLEKCVNSIINQTYKNLEIILVDDGSPDSCPTICDDLAKKDKRVKVIHKQNGGVSSARNDALNIATGDFIAFVDSDDWIDPTMYEKLINKQFENNSDLVFCKYKIVDNENTYNYNESSLEKLCKNNDLSYFFNRSSDLVFDNNTLEIKNNIMCNIWRALFKKEIIADTKFNTQIRYMEDLEFMCKILCDKNLKLDFVDEYLYFYLKRPTSASFAKSNKIIDNCIELINCLTQTMSNTNYKQLVDAFKFFCYGECCLSKYVLKADISLEPIKKWNSKNNYKLLKNISFGWKTKLKYFLIKHKMFFTLKLLYKIKSN